MAANHNMQRVLVGTASQQWGTWVNGWVGEWVSEWVWWVPRYACASWGSGLRPVSSWGSSLGWELTEMERVGERGERLSTNTTTAGHIGSSWITKAPGDKEGTWRGNGEEGYIRWLLYHTLFTFQYISQLYNSERVTYALKFLISSPKHQGHGKKGYIRWLLHHTFTFQYNKPAV